jgi:succinate dehydrogenase / fumarate reductase, membrane anchor subunit
MTAMSRYSRSGRPRPQSGGFELAGWYYMRLSGVALFVLALLHFSVMHFIFDPSQEKSGFIDARWSDVLIRSFDWLFLAIVLSHAFMGVRTVTMDYLHGRARTFALMGLYFLGIVIFVMGTMVVMTANIQPVN